VLLAWPPNKLSAIVAVALIGLQRVTNLGGVGIVRFLAPDKSCALPFRRKHENCTS
jgi:hypothetical protein